MVECGICLEEYKEGDLELHRQMCVLRLMFRCTLCNEDFVSKEGLWNHLDLHEIVDESKEVNYVEIKAKHKLHQCVLCNDQRAYAEGPYWRHVHDVHDGFFLRCSDCGENFRSEQLKDDHTPSHCKGRHGTVAFDFITPKEEPALIDVKIITSDTETLKSPRAEKSSDANEVINNGLSEHSRIHLNIVDKESEVPTSNLTSSEDLPSLFTCNKCGQTFLLKGFFLRHQKAKRCMNAKQKRCHYCRKLILIKEYLPHLALCEKKEVSCELCPLKFRTSEYLARHKEVIHPLKRTNAKNDQNQVKNIQEKTIHLAGKRTTRSGSRALPSSLESSSSSNVVEHTDISSGKEDIADDKSEQQPVDNVSSKSTGTKCLQCDKECVTAGFLRQHVTQCHQPIKCSICGIITEGSSRARYHKITKHTKPGYECAVCRKKFHCLRQYKRHGLKHNKRLPKVRDSVKSKLSSPTASGKPLLKDKSDLKVTTENPSSEQTSSKCSHCGIEESSADTLARHILMNHDPVACDFCGVNMSNLSQAKHHMKTMHKESKQKCPHCSMQCFSKVRLRRHLSKCSDGKVPCDFCGRMFIDAAAVKKHSYICPAYKNSKKQVQKNAKTELGDKTDSSTAEDKKEPPLVNSGLSQTKCYYCYEEFSSPGYLRHHWKSIHELTKCEFCGITVLGISATKNHKIKYHKEATHECPTCGKKFLYKKLMDAHCLKCDGLDSSQVTGNDPSMVSATTLNCCDICGITLRSYYQIRYHKRTKHSEEKYECPHCARKFHFKDKFDYHASCCARLKHLCELCGEKFNHQRRLAIHKARAHNVNIPLRNVNYEGADCTNERKQNSAWKIDAAQETTSCIICRITFASIDELKKHKRTCPKHAKKYDKFQLLRDVKETQPQGPNVDLNLEIKVEDAILQEQEHRVSNEDTTRSFSTILRTHGRESKDDEFLENAIKIKQEFLEDEEDTELQTTTQSSECRGIFINRNESRVREEAVDQFYPCSICGFTFGSRKRFKYHKIVRHTEPQYECTRCQRMFHFSHSLRCHEKRCSELQCHTCGIKFETRRQRNKHNKRLHDGKSKDIKVEDADHLENSIKVKESRNQSPEAEGKILTEHQLTKTESLESH